MEEISNFSSSPSLKRQREENDNNTLVEKEEEEILKRQKSYKDIITLLEQEEDEPTQDLSSLISTLQEEIISTSSSSSSPELNPGHGPSDPENPGTGSGFGPGSGSDEEEGGEVLKHLLQASDDELGIPNTSNGMDGFDDLLGGGHVDSGDFVFPLGGEGLWEFEDHEAANYYSFLQSSQIFL